MANFAVSQNLGGKGAPKWCALLALKCEVFLYLLFLDESGTHESSPCFIVAGFAIHEHDAYHLQRAINCLLEGHLAPLGYQARQFELHANEIKNPESRQHKYSPWKQVEYETRRRIISDAYRILANFHPADERLPMAMFATIVDKKKYGLSIEREKVAYELVLNKFDAMLGRIYRNTDERQRGLVVHDRRVVAERDIQDWTDSWRDAAGRIGRLTNFAEVPLFADSRASRLLQAADLVAYAAWRYYGLPAPDDRYIEHLWQVFDHVGKEMHGIIHMSPAFAKGECSCPPCASRIANGSIRYFSKLQVFSPTAVTQQDIDKLRLYFDAH